MSKHDMSELGQPVGLAVPGWSPPPRPSKDSMAGRFCTLEALDPERHGRDLYDANGLDEKGRNRDTAWYAAMDHEWPEISKAFGRWLDPSNFDDQGNQIERLSSFTRSSSPVS